MIGQAERVIELKKLSALGGQKQGEKIVAFTSGKGGTGKTFVSLNIAFYLASIGKKVLFVDLDTNLANSNIMLNVVPDETIFNLLNKKYLIDDVISEYNKNLHIIFGDSGRSDFPVIKEDLSNFLFSKLMEKEKDYDLIMIDTGSGASEEIFNILTRCNSIVLVTTPEPTSVMDAYVMIKLLKKYSFTGDKLLFVNRCTNEEEGKTAFGNLNSASKHFLKESIKLLGYIDYDSNVNKSILAQELLLKNNPDLRISHQLSRYSRKLLEYVQMANIHQKSKSTIR